MPAPWPIVSDASCWRHVVDDPDYLYPVAIDIHDVAAISSGFSHDCALSISGTVSCWGHGDSGRLGNGGSATSKTPVAVVTGP